MRRYGHRGFDFGDFQITKREILASISIIAIMLLIGVLIAGKISDHDLDKNEMYRKAIKIDTQELFEYGMRTSAGNAFVYGELKAVDTVTYPELDQRYMYVEKVREQYTQHTRQVSHTEIVDGKTKTYYTTETYWTWDKTGSEAQKCKELTFLGHTFPSEKIELPQAEHIGTITESSHVRYNYYGVSPEFTGTIFTELKDGTISDNSSFYAGSSIAETSKYLESLTWIRIFWIFWIILTGLCVYGFYYIDNEWLE